MITWLIATMALALLAVHDDDGKEQFSRYVESHGFGMTVALVLVASGIIAVPVAVVIHAIWLGLAAVVR